MTTLRWILVSVSFLAAWVVAGRAWSWRLQPSESTSVRTTIVLSETTSYGSCGRWIDARQAGLESLERSGEWRVGAFDSSDTPSVSRHRILVNGEPLPAPHSMHDWIGENRSGYSFWGKRTSKGKIYFSLPEVAGEPPLVEAEWVLERRRTWGDVMSATAIGAAGAALLFTSFSLAPHLASAGTIAILTLFLTGSAACALPRLFGASTSIEVVTLADKARGLGMAAISVAATCAVVATLSRRWRAAIAPESGWELAAHGWTRPWVVLAVTASCLLLTTCCVRSDVMPISFWRVGNHGCYEIAGRLHFTDAGGWFNEGLGLAAGEQINWAGRRPLHALSRAGQFFLSGGSATAACGIQLLLLTLGTASLVITVARTISPAGALVTWLVLAQAGAGMAPAYMSEAIGFSAACIAVALLLDGASGDSFSRRVAGWIVMGLALAIRPGPLLLAGVAPWSELFGAGRHRIARAVAAGVAVIAASIAASAVFSRISVPGAMMNANATHTLFGLAHGTTWGKGQEIFFAADPSRASLPERDAAQLMFKLAVQRMLEQPWDALQKLARDTANGVLALTRETPSALTRPILEPAIGKYGSRAVAFLLLGLASIGLIQQSLRRQPVAEMTTWALLATLASLPLIWGDGEWRGVTVSIPVLGAFLACATIAQLPSYRLAPTRLQHRSSAARRNPVLLAGAFACIALPLAGLLAFESNRGIPRSALVVSLVDSDSVLVAREHGFISPFGVTTVSHEDFCAALRRFHPSYGVPGPLAELEPPFLVTSHCPSRKSRWTVVPGVDPGRGSAIRILATRDTNSEMVVVATAWEYVE